MVMILRKSLDSQGADAVTCQPFSPELHTPKKMSRGPTLLSCGMMESDRWRELDRKCPLQVDQPRAGLWECQDGALWPRDSAACAVTSLIQDLSLSDRHGHPSAPPSKRQCRSLSFSDEMAGCRTSWRPLGSRVWTPVEKRRCFSGGSVPRCPPGAGPMQRSSSFSLPSRPGALSPAHEPAWPPRRPSRPPRSPEPGPAPAGRPDTRRSLSSLSCSHERFASAAEDCPPSASSTPASTPELARRSSGLARSRSQPCVLSDKKAGVKRRRPEDGPEQRPSLDLAKMAQNCQTFSSLSCLSTSGDDGPPSPHVPHTGAPRPPALDPETNRTLLDTPLDEPSTCREEPFCEEEGGRRGCRAGASPCSLDGELDIEQIENN